MWRVMLCLTRPSGPRLDAASQFVTVLGRKGLTSPGSSVSAGRVSSAQLISLKLHRPSLSGLSVSRCFATKAYTQAKSQAPADPVGPVKHSKPPQIQKAKEADARKAPVQGFRGPPWLLNKPASGRDRTGSKPAAAPVSSKPPHKKPLHPRHAASQSSSLTNRQSPSTDTFDSFPDPDHDRRVSSLSGNASTSGTAPSNNSTSRNRSSSRAARNVHRGTTPGAASSHSAAGVLKAPEDCSSGTPTHQSAPEVRGSGTPPPQSAPKIHGSASSPAQPVPEVGGKGTSTPQSAPNIHGSGTPPAQLPPELRSSDTPPPQSALNIGFGTSPAQSAPKVHGSGTSPIQSAPEVRGSGSPPAQSAPKLHGSGTPTPQSAAQSADSPNKARRHPEPRPSAPPPASPPPAILGNAAASESASSLRAESHSSPPAHPQQGSPNPNTTSSGSPQDTPASTATSNAVQDTISLPSAPHVQPSMYAQKALPFDVSASRQSGTTAIRDLLETQKITLQEYAPGQKPKALCPRCHGGSQHEASLAVNISVDSHSAAWLCHRATCGWQGAIDQRTALPKSKKVAVSKVEKPQTSNFQPLDPQLLQYFAKRGISKETLERNQVAQEHTWMPGQPANAAPAIAFPYLRNGEVVNVKYRTMDKSFRQVKGAEKILYGLDDVVGQDTIIIVEGEMDKLALEEAGFRNVVSVPDGAPAKVKEGAVPAPDVDTKYSYLWNCRAVLDQATRVLMATDNDPPGHALAEELARRLGRERCYRVQWENLPEPEEATTDLSEEQPAEATFRKDANEVLMKDGPQALRFFIDQAEPLPIRGLFRFSDFEQDVWSLYNLEFGDQMGKSTGWQGLDEVYRVVPGELTIITGVPNSGKSEWIDALMVNLADRFGWRFGLCSMEKKVTDHARQLMEKHMKKPFFDGGYAGSTPRMSAEEVQEGMAWVDDRFFPIRYEDEALPSVDWVLNVAKAAVLRYGIRGLLVDPYNELDHQRPSHMSETEYVSQMLTKIKRFAQHHDVHVWFVAHPRQLRDWKGQPPTMYDISGSAHFINKADNGLVVHRNRDPEAGPMNEVQIFVRKVRNKAAGTIGDCKLEYDRATGCYLDHSQIAGSDTSSHLFSSFAQPSSESAGPFLPPPGPTYDEVLQKSPVNGDVGIVPKVAAAAAAAPASLSAVDKVFLNQSSGQNKPERNHIAQHINVPEGPLSTEELEYNDTDVKPGDPIQQFQNGRSVHVMGAR